MTVTDSIPDVSAKQIAWATAGAVLAAVVILFVAVLPYEYSIDPLHTGKALGLLRGEVTPNAQSAPVSLTEALTPVLSGPLSRFGAAYRTDRVTLELPPYQFLEYKYHLAQGATMVFTWDATAPVIYDLHGAPDGSGPGDPQPSVDKGTNARGFGTLVAPFAGMHGWYWENPGGTPITVVLTSAGFYSSAVEYRSNRTTRPHQLTIASATPDSEPN